MHAGFGDLRVESYPQSYPQVLGLPDFGVFAHRVFAWSSSSLTCRSISPSTAASRVATSMVTCMLTSVVATMQVTRARSCTGTCAATSGVTSGVTWGVSPAPRASCRPAGQ